MIVLWKYEVHFIYFKVYDVCKRDLGIESATVYILRWFKPQTTINKNYLLINEILM